MFLRIIILILCSIGFFTGEARAQLFLENGKETLAVSGGEHVNGSMIIHNTSPDPAAIKVYWEDFEYKTPYDGTKNFLPAGTAPSSASQWVTFSPQEFTLPGMGQQRVDYSITVPPSIQEGHYGVLFFEKNNGPINDEKEINLVTRVGSLFFIEPKDKVKKAALEDINLKANSFNASFVNQGNVILIPHTTYYIMQGQGLVLLRGDANKLYVPPGASASLVIPLKKKLDAGHYTMVVNADLEEGDVVVKEINFGIDTDGQLTLENT